MRTIYCNDRWLPDDAPALLASDRGFAHGAGLFETLIAVNGHPWRLDRHVARLKQSAAALHLPLTDNVNHMHVIVTELLERNALRDARLRITVSAGATGDASQPVLPTSVVTAAPFEPYPAAWYDRGVTVLVSRFDQRAGEPTAGHKTLSYLPRLIALREAHERGCQEALWLTPDRRLAEACMSNLFLVKDGALLTPPTDTPVLPGITREAVLTIAAAAGIETRVADAAIDDLLAADEVFLTSVGLRVMPVSRIEKHVVGDEKPGPTTRRLAAELNALIERETHGQNGE